MLEADGLYKRYGSITALDDVRLTVRRGQMVGLLGPNGAGKTTAMRAIMQLVSVDAGSVRWDGAPVDAAARQRFGYMPAERGMYPRMRVRDHLVYYGKLSGMSSSDAGVAADRWLERLDLTERAADDIQALSSGNQQRMQLALALVNDPELLVLDEPFSGLDPVAVSVLSAVLSELVAGGAALLLSSHQLDLVADVCSTVAILDRGRLVLHGEVSELRAAAGHRFAELEFAEPTSWSPSSPGATVVDAGERRVRVRVLPDVDPADILRDAQGAAAVRSFSFEPPDLSEVFLDAVGRSTLQPADDARADGDGDGRRSGQLDAAAPIRRVAR